jgi:hypothetical protein
MDSQVVFPSLQTGQSLGDGGGYLLRLRLSI